MMDDLGPAAAGLCCWLEAALSADRANVMVHLERRHAALVSTLVAQLRGGEPTDKLGAVGLTEDEAFMRSMAEAGVEAHAARQATQESAVSMLGRALAPIEYSLNALLLKVQEHGGTLSGTAAPTAFAASHVATSANEMRVSQEPRVDLPGSFWSSKSRSADGGEIPPEESARAGTQNGNQHGNLASGNGAYIIDPEESARGRYRNRDGSAEREVPQERNAHSRTRGLTWNGSSLSSDQGAPIQTSSDTPRLGPRGPVEFRQGANPADVSQRLNPLRPLSAAMSDTRRRSP